MLFSPFSFVHPSALHFDTSSPRPGNGAQRAVLARDAENRVSNPPVSPSSNPRFFSCPLSVFDLRTNRTYCHIASPALLPANSMLLLLLTHPCLKRQSLDNCVASSECEPRGRRILLSRTTEEESRPTVHTPVSHHRSRSQFLPV